MVEFKERKPLSDVGQIVIQPPAKNVVHTNEKETIKDGGESANTSCVYSPMSVDHEKSMHDSSHFSLTAHRLSCDIDIYTSELYSYLRDVEVVNNFLIGSTLNNYY